MSVERVNGRRASLAEKYAAKISIEQRRTLVDLHKNWMPLDVLVVPTEFRFEVAVTMEWFGAHGETLFGCGPIIDSAPLSSLIGSNYLLFE